MIYNYSNLFETISPVNKALGIVGASPLHSKSLVNTYPPAFCRFVHISISIIAMYRSHFYNLLSGSVIKATNILVALKWILVFFNMVTESKLFTVVCAVARPSNNSICNYFWSNNPVGRSILLVVCTLFYLKWIKQISYINESPEVVNEIFITNTSKKLKTLTTWICSW